MIKFTNMPVETQSSIIEKLDGEALLAVRGSCKLWNKIADMAIVSYFEKVCFSENYAKKIENVSELKAGLDNIRISLAAKVAWHSGKVWPIQHSKVRALEPNEMTRRPPYHEVSMILKGARSLFLFSEEGCRLQRSQLIINTKLCEVSIASKELFLKQFLEFGHVKEALAIKDSLLLITKIESSFYFIFQHLSGFEKTQLMAKDILCQSLREGRLILGTEEGMVYDYRFDEMGSLTLLETMMFLKPIDFVYALSGNGIAAISGSTLSLSFPEEGIKEYTIKEMTGLQTNAHAIFAMENGNLITLNPQSSSNFYLVRPEVLSFIALEHSFLLITTNDGFLELRHSNSLIVSCKLEKEETLSAATRQGDFLALAFKSGELAVFDLKEGLKKLYSTDDFMDRCVHALLFNNSLELFITTTDGSIFSIRPFPSDHPVSSENTKKEPEQLIEVFRRYCYNIWGSISSPLR